MSNDSIIIISFRALKQLFLCGDKVEDPERRINHTAPPCAWCNLTLSVCFCLDSRAGRMVVSAHQKVSQCPFFFFQDVKFVIIETMSRKSVSKDS